MEEKLLSGNEAIARGAYEAGVKVCSAYPGTPSTEVFENLPQYGDAQEVVHNHQDEKKEKTRQLP